MSFRAIACVLQAALVLLLSGAKASKLLPAHGTVIDGSSVGGRFFAKLDTMHAARVSGTNNTVAAPASAPSSGALGQTGMAPPPLPPGGTPCYLGGDDCTDYEWIFDHCNTFSCNKEQKRCVAVPVEEGTACGEDGDPWFGECNKGPGSCRTIESEYGDFGTCLGTPTPGASCDDWDECTVSDKCEVVETDDGYALGTCMGTFVEDKTCNDYDDCTTNDRCQLMESDYSEGAFPICRGDVAEGQPCNDYNDCTADDQCIKVDSRWAFDHGVRCTGTVQLGKPCDDYDGCTVNDACVASDYDFGHDYGFERAVCRGEVAEGLSCSDYDPCTVDDVCTASDYGDFAVCRGNPAPGNPCDDFNSCTTSDVCVMSSSGARAYCSGEPTTVGAACDDYNPSTVDDTCKVWESDYGDYSYCEGTWDADAPYADAYAYDYSAPYAAPYPVPYAGP